MFDDPAVRSVRVALALCDRFTELLKGPTTVRAAKQRGALVGVSGDQEGLSMRIGEAQQIYPEIWQHLDEARKVFAERGIDVSAFDRIREVEGTGLGADVGLEHHSYGYGSRGVDQQVKTAGFNTQGLGRARQACKALMDATPEIDWKAIAAAEGADPAAAEFGRAQRNKRFMRFAALALLIAAPFGVVMYMRHQERVKREEYQQHYEATHERIEPLSDADHAAIKKLISDLRPPLISAIAKWPEAFSSDSLAATKPGTAPCPHVIKPPTQAAMDRMMLDGTGDPSFTSSDFYGYPVEKPVPDYVVADWLRTLEGIEKRLAANTATHFDRESLEAIKPFIVVVLVDKEVHPDITGTGSAMTYTPGQVLARGYVFSLRDSKIVCAVAIDVKNTPAEDFSYIDAFRVERDGLNVLHREIELRIRESLSTGLRAL